LWHELLENCSPESIRSRFFSLIKEFTHDMAARYCCIDYDREMAIIPELQSGEDRKMLGVGRLVADPDHETAEYAVIVADAWQGQGLGLLLTDYCLEIAKSWGIKRVEAVTTMDNGRMITLFDKYGFEQRTDESERLVHAMKRL
jgi:acetyltransferase